MRDLISGLLLSPSGSVRLVSGNINLAWIYVLFIAAILFTIFQFPFLLDQYDLILVICWSICHFLFWPLMMTGALEPLFTRIILLGISDEQEIYWRRDVRDTYRRATVFSSAVSMILFYLLYIGFSRSSWAGLLAAILTMGWFMAWITVFLNKKLNFTVSFGITISFVIFALGIFLVILTQMSFLLLLILLIGLGFTTWLFNHDIRIRLFLLPLVKDPALPDLLLEEEMGTFVIELLHQSGDQRLSRRVLELLRSGGINTGKVPLLMRLLNRHEKYMESIQLGLRHAEELSDQIEYQLAMAEASFGARDPENAAAHAEEAFELGNGLGDINVREALLLLSLASYNMVEVMTGTESCVAIHLGPNDSSLRGKRIVKEAQYLKRKFENQATEEVY